MSRRNMALATAAVLMLLVSGFLYLVRKVESELAAAGALYVECREGGGSPDVCALGAIR